MLCATCCLRKKRKRKQTWEFPKDNYKKKQKIESTFIFYKPGWKWSIENNSYLLGRSNLLWQPKENVLRSIITPSLVEPA